MGAVHVRPKDDAGTIRCALAVEGGNPLAFGRGARLTG